jgi:hypothetical protein
VGARCDLEADDLVQAAVAAALTEAAEAVEDYCADAPDLAGHGHSVGIRDAILAAHPRRERVMQWILLLIQMNASIADLHYVELYETLEQCTADLQEISPRLEPHEVMLCIEANN